MAERCATAAIQAAGKAKAWPTALDLLARMPEAEPKHILNVFCCLGGRVPLRVPFRGHG